MALSEAIIIQRCQAGELSEFTALYDTYVKTIYNFLYYRTHHRELAEDLTSQTFIKALEKINTFQVKKGSFSTWLFRIARNTLFDHFRTEKTTIDLSEAWEIKADTDIAREVNAKERLEKVRNYLKKLSPRERDIVIMRLWDNLAFKEIAEVLGKNEASLKMTFYRTIAKIQAKIPLTILYLLTLKHIF